MELGSTQLDLKQIHRQFAATSYGVTLGENIRFSPFKPAHVTNKEWERTLGPDVNNLLHLPLSHRLTDIFLMNCAASDTEATEAVFSDDEREVLLFTATVHDWGEAVVGDIPFHEKSEEDEQQEMVILKDMLPEVLGGTHSREQVSYYADSAIAVLSDRKSKLGRAFNAIEIAGYVRTGIRAWHQSKQVNGELSPALFKMSQKVVSDHVEKLSAYAEIYPPIKSYVEHHQNTFISIYDASCPRGS